MISNTTVSNRGTKRASEPDVARSTDASHLTPKDLEEIRARYIGSKDSNTKRMRRFDNRHDVFDWNEGDDTGVSSMASRSTTILSKRNDHLDSDLHWSSKKLADMKERDWRIFKEDFSISTQGTQVPHPIRRWNEAPLDKRALGAIDRMGYEEPTPIQRQAIPVSLIGRDLIGLAETGSGKTLAFILPILQKILQLPKIDSERAQNGPYALILTPTRELSVQIEKVVSAFQAALAIKGMAIVGGHSIAEQSIKLRQCPEIIVATPGRLRDCLEQHVLVLNQCHFLVLDEADRMIELNFEEDLTYILNCLPTREKFHIPRQTAMFSATMSSAVEKIAKLYLHQPVVVKIGETGQTTERILQTVEYVDESSKNSRIIAVLEKNDLPAIVFVNQKITVDALATRLQAYGFKTIALHGGKGQEQREFAISQIRSRVKDVLVATDVASRGIDIPDIKLVVNYDMAKTLEDYTHRIGRTGRAGQEGAAITFINDHDTELFFDLHAFLKKSRHTPLPEAFLLHEATRTKPGTVQKKRRQEEQIFAFGV